MNNDLSQPHVHKHIADETIGAGGGSESALSDLLCVGDIVNEFSKEIPDHIGEMPYLSRNGVSRNEMEWKHISFAMAREIVRLREALVYVAHAGHKTPLHMLPSGVMLGGSNTVEVKLNAGVIVVAKFDT